MALNLIITNGDAAGSLLRAAFPGTEVLPWRDVLHEGPVPYTQDLATLTEIRADFLAERGWGDRAQLESELKARDRGLEYSANFSGVTLWFEHDLYDQLQLLQILDWFEAHPRESGSLLLVQASDFLGRQSPEQLRALKDSERPVAAEQIALGAMAFTAFRAETPEPWHDLLKQDLSSLTFLRPAVQRMLEELPGPDGLSRSERQILASLRESAMAPPALFVAAQRQEQATFMGDWSFFRLLDGLSLAERPLIEGLEAAPFLPNSPHLRSYLESKVRLTPFGQAVLGGEDQAQLNEIDRWWGGTHLTNDALWRYDMREERLIAPA